MSMDAKYVIQLEGPFGEGELESVIEAMKPFDFEVWDYDTIIGWTKWSKDEEVIAAAKLSTPTEVFRRNDDQRWERIWDSRDEKKLVS